MAIMNIILGIVLLVSGRKLFWLFVGIVGFVVGFTLATRFFSDQSEWLVIVIAIVAGLIGAALASVAQKLAVAIAGFMAGGYILTAMLDMLGATFGMPEWLVYLIGGIIGSLLVMVLFDWALILLSSLTGASLLVQAIDTSRMIGLLIFIVLLVIGIGIQFAGLRPKRTAPVA